MTNITETSVELLMYSVFEYCMLELPLNMVAELDTSFSKKNELIANVSLWGIIDIT